MTSFMGADDIHDSIIAETVVSISKFNNVKVRSPFQNIGCGASNIV